MNLAEVARHLATSTVEERAREGLVEGGEVIAEEVRRTLGRRPGDDHAAPWLGTGALRESIYLLMQDDTVIVGSSSPVAAFQEHGTARVPPRPFLVPAAHEAASKVRDVVVGKVMEALRRS